MPNVSIWLLIHLGGYFPGFASVGEIDSAGILAIYQVIGKWAT